MTAVIYYGPIMPAKEANFYLHFSDTIDWKNDEAVILEKDYY
jgi:hypothetical protein